MPPPIVNVGANPILAGNAIPVPQAGNVDNQNNVPVPEVDNNNPVNAPTNALLPELEGPNLQPGNGQVRNFAANHVVEYGKNWDLESAGGMLKTAQKAVEKIKSVISGDKAFDAYVLSMEKTVDDVCKQAVESGSAVSDADKNELKNLLDDIRALADEIVLVRSTLTDAVKDGSGVADPRAAIAQIRKTLRVFRYEMQVQLGKKGHYAGRMEANEGNLRALQNTFTFFVGSKIGTTFPRVWEREDELFGQLAQKDRELRAKLQSIFLRVELPEPPKDMRLFDVVGEALDLSHNTNNQIRQFQDRDASAATLRHIVGPIAEKGGFRKVEFTAGVGALIGLGFSTAFTAGLRAGARFRVVGEIQCLGKDTPLHVTFRIVGGAETKFGATSGDEWTGNDAKLEAVAGVELGHFSTRSYQTLDDLIRDADNCKLATSRTVGSAIFGGIMSLGKSIYRLGRSFFRWLGRRADEVKRDSAQYLLYLKEIGVAGMLDKMLGKRANPMIVAERKGWTLTGQAGTNFNLKLIDGVLDLGGGNKISTEKEYRVKGRYYTSFTRFIRNLPPAADLNALMLAGSDGGPKRPVEEFTAANASALYSMLDHEFEALMVEGDAAVKRRIGFWRRMDMPAIARAANKLRSLLLATELAVRKGRLSREAADALFERYSNPSFKFPWSIYREYFMVDVGAAKPAKIRDSASVQLKFGLFTGATDGITSGITNGIGQAIASGAVQEMRHQAGLDTTFQYRFSSETPAQPGADPRPWENTVKTTHELAITASTPIRFILDAISRSVVNKGARLENKSKSIAKDTVKGATKGLASDIPIGFASSTIVGLLLASAKAAIKAKLEKWLSDPANVQKLVLFALEHAGEALDTILDVALWACEHPWSTQEILGCIKGSTLIAETERAKVVSWTFVDGELDTIAVSSEMSSKLGFNVDPVGIAVGIGFDLSYNVTESVKDRSVSPRPTLTMLLEKGEQYLFGETGLEPMGTGEALKQYLSRNALGVSYMLENLKKEENSEKAQKLYDDAYAAAERDVALQQRLEEAWNEVQGLADDATLYVKVAAAHKLIVAMVLAYRTPLLPNPEPQLEP